MLKKFFISMLGTIAGVWIAITIAICCLVGIIGAFAGSMGAAEPKVEKHSALYIDLSGEIYDRYQPGDVIQMLRETESGTSLIDILESIRLAANDKRIDGIYINCAGSAAGMATREEIVEALEAFKTSGKWIYAYADTYSQGDYMLATLADSLIVNPMGSVDIHGLTSTVPFFKEFAEKVGIKFNIVRVGTYKSAVEPFMGTEMSPASREQTIAMLDTLWGYATGVISANRQVTDTVVNMWADSIIGTWSSRQLAPNRVVTSLKYRRQAEDDLRRLCELDEEDELRLVTPAEYMSTVSAPSASNEHIAVLFAEGEIVDSGKEGIVGPTMVKEIIDLADNEDVSGMVLRVNSPGGSAFASEQIWEALEYFKSKDKPLYVSMGDYAASGGYYISCGADKIYADRTTLTGSIGVYGMIPDLSGLVTDKLGIHFSTVTTNPESGAIDMLTGTSPHMLAAMQRGVDDIYDTFTSRVAQGRNMPQDSVKVIAEGRVWVGSAAVGLGLVDSLGSLRTAITDLAQELDLDTDRVVFYPEINDNGLSQLIRQVKDNVEIDGVTVDANALKTARLVEYIRNMSRIQARMMPLSIE